MHRHLTDNSLYIPFVYLDTTNAMKLTHPASTFLLKQPLMTLVCEPVKCAATFKVYMGKKKKKSAFLERKPIKRSYFEKLKRE